SVIRGDASGLAIRAEILAWVIAEARCIRRADPATAVARAVCLSGVLYDRESRRFREPFEGIHRRRPAVEMDGYYDFRARRKCCCHALDVDGIPWRLDIDEDDFGAGVG